MAYGPIFKPPTDKVPLDPVFQGYPKQLDFSLLPEEGMEWAKTLGHRQRMMEPFTLLRVYGGYYGETVKHDGQRVAGGLETHLKVLSELMATDYPVTIHVLCRAARHDEKDYRVKGDGWLGEVNVHPVWGFGAKPRKDAALAGRLIGEHDVDVVHLHNPSGQAGLAVALMAESLDAGLSVTYHSVKRNITWSNRLKRYAKRAGEILKEHVDEEGAAAGIPAFLMEVAQKGVMKAVRGRGVSLKTYDTALRGRKSPYASASLCGISEAAGEEFQGRDHLIVGNPIDTEYFSPKKADLENCARISAEHGLEGKKVILYHARMEPDKGQLDLVDVASRLRKRFGDGFKVAMMGTVGDKKYLSLLEKKAAEAGVKDNIIVLPAQTQADIRDWLHIADAMAFPTHYEAFGRSGAEALAMETPVVAYDVGGIHEYVREGKTGRLVSKGDTEALAKALEQVLTDEALAKSMGNTGRRLIEDEYSACRVCDNYIRYVYSPQIAAKEDKKRKNNKLQ
jgi:glycosyltransferase involved in cell wall biosynthesis